jgi:hypothetical protein
MPSLGSQRFGLNDLLVKCQSRSCRLRMSKARLELPRRVGIPGNSTEPCAEEGPQTIVLSGLSGA